MTALATIYMEMTIEETITALTLNAAAAIDRAETVGSLEPGRKLTLSSSIAPIIDTLLSFRDEPRRNRRQERCNGQKTYKLNTARNNLIYNVINDQHSEE